MRNSKQSLLRNVAIDPVIHKRVRVMAAETNKTMRKYVEIALLKELPRVKK